MRRTRWCIQFGNDGLNGCTLLIGREPVVPATHPPGRSAKSTQSKLPEGKVSRARRGDPKFTLTASFPPRVPTTVAHGKQPLFESDDDTMHNAREERVLAHWYPDDARETSIKSHAYCITEAASEGAAYTRTHSCFLVNNDEGCAGQAKTAISGRISSNVCTSPAV